MATFSLSAAGLLYAGATCGGTHFWGVPDLWANLDKAEFLRQAHAARDSLVDSGCASLDFSGTVVLNPEFEALVKTAVQSEKALMLAKKEPNGQIPQKSFYKVKDNVVRLDKTGNVYTLSDEKTDKLDEEILEFLAKPGDEKAPAGEELRADTRWLEKLAREKDAQTLVRCGMKPEEAQKVANLFCGQGQCASMVEISEKGAGEPHILYSGKDGMYTGGLEYTETQEMMVLKPIQEETLKQKVQMQINKM